MGLLDGTGEEDMSNGPRIMAWLALLGAVEVLFFTALYFWLG